MTKKTESVRERLLRSEPFLDLYLLIVSNCLALGSAMPAFMGAYDKASYCVAGAVFLRVLVLLPLRSSDR